MLDIPGKACGPCTFCCKVLEIDELKKPAGPFCAFCVPGGGCKTYETRPAVCRDFHCLWKSDRGLTPMLRPDKVGALLMEDADSEEYLAVCDPAKPLALAHADGFRAPRLDRQDGAHRQGEGRGQGLADPCQRPVGSVRLTLVTRDSPRSRGAPST